MKFLRFLLPAMAVMACSGNIDPEEGQSEEPVAPFTLSVDKDVIESDGKDEAVLTITDAEGKVLSLLTHYTDDDTAAAKSVALDFGRTGRYEVYLLDETHDGELIQTTDKLEFALTNQSVLLIKEI